jgi:hypothetical protein
MLWSRALEDVLDKFEILRSPNLRIMISLSKSGGKGGVFGSIMSMKMYTTIEYIHGNVFPRQGKKKVYVFKMLINGLRSGVDLVKEKIWRTCGSCLTMSNVSRHGLQWLVTYIMQGHDHFCV